MASGKARAGMGEPTAKKAAGGKKSVPQLGVTLSGLQCAGQHALRDEEQPASEEQTVELYRRFFPHSSEIDAELFVDAHRSVETMAGFQGLLLRLEQEDATPDRVAV